MGALPARALLVSARPIRGNNTANSHSNNASEMGVAIAVAWHLNGLHTAARGCKLNFLICC